MLYGKRTTLGIDGNLNDKMVCDYIIHTFIYIIHNDIYKQIYKNIKYILNINKKNNKKK